MHNGQKDIPGGLVSPTLLPFDAPCKYSYVSNYPIPDRAVEARVEDLGGGRHNILVKCKSGDVVAWEGVALPPEKR